MPLRSLHEAKEVLIHAAEETDFVEIVSALDTVHKTAKTRTIDSCEFTTIAQALIEKVAPLLGSASQELGKKAFASFDDIFLSGAASISFQELCSALAVGNENAEVVARTLVLFVDSRTGGVERLRTVLCAAGDESRVSALVHLPSRILNILYAESVINFDPADVLQAENYYSTLAEAIYLQPRTADPLRDQMLRELLGRLVKMKHTNVLVMSWLSIGSVDRIVEVILRAPQISVEHLVRSLLSVSTDRAVEERRVVSVLKEVVLESKIACEACISRIPFQQPLFKRPRTGLKRLVNAVETGGGRVATLRALDVVAETWSRESFVKFADIQLQRQVSRLLLYYLRSTADDITTEYINDGESVMMVLVQGVHLRLSENDVRVQRHGMVIGEASSRYCKDKNPLSFERGTLSSAREDAARVAGDDQFEDGADSDFSELALKVGCATSDHEDAVAASVGDLDINLDNDSAEIRGGRAPTTTFSEADLGGDSAREGHKGKSGGCRSEGKDGSLSWGGNCWTTGGDDNDNEPVEDDWTSIESYELTSSDEETSGTKNGDVGKTRERDYELLRKKIAAPLSVPRMLGLLRDVNKSAGGAVQVDASTATAALRSLARRAGSLFMSRRTTLHACAQDLCLEVVYVDPDRYPDELMGVMVEARRGALQRLLELDIVGCGCTLVEKVICGQHSDVGRRSECLAVLSAGVRGAAKRAADVARSEAEKQAHIAAERERLGAVRIVGTVTRRLSQSVSKGGTAQGVKVRPAWNDEGLAKLFHNLAGRLCAGGGADFIDLGKRDNQLWAQGILTLSTIAENAGVSETGAQLRADVIEIAMERVLGEMEADAVVRRGCALALGGVVQAMSDWEVDARIVNGVGSGTAIGRILSGAGDEARGIARAADWLQTRAGEDADVGVRRFAARSLRLWASRVDGVSRGRGG